MKKILALFIILLLMSCAVKQKGSDGTPGKVSEPSENRKISIHDIKRSMEYLASDELGVKRLYINYFKS